MQIDRLRSILFPHSLFRPDYDYSIPEDTAAVKERREIVGQTANLSDSPLLARLFARRRRKERRRRCPTCN